jgi:hypothetical protein
MSSSSSSDLRHERHTWMEQHLFPNRDGVGYGLSSYNVPIVTDDPYRYSLSRVVCVYAASVILMIYFVTKLRGLYELVKAHAPTNVCLLRAVVLVAVSVVVSGVHHYDNFWHVEEYHLASWIYNGYFFIFDFGVMNWIVAAIFAVFGLQTLIKNTTAMNSPPSNKQSPSQSHYHARLWGMRCMYVHCVMIWSGQLHYSMESIFNFSTIANISILSEGICAIVLHLYLLWYGNELLLPNETDVEYAHVPTTDPDAANEGPIAMTSTSSRNSKAHDHSGSVPTTQAVRRRSKDASNI